MEEERAVWSMFQLVTESYCMNITHFEHIHKARVGNTLIGFSSDSLIFCEQKSDSLVKKSEWLPSLFCHERPETIAHGCSFVKSNGSESLKTLSEKEPMIGGSDLLLGIKRGKFVKNIQKYEFFKRFARSLQAICSFFASDSLESQANHSHRSFLKSNSLFCKELCE